jgi:hypothetical protein
MFCDPVFFLKILVGNLFEKPERKRPHGKFDVDVKILLKSIRQENGRCVR